MTAPPLGPRLVATTAIFVENGRPGKAVMVDGQRRASLQAVNAGKFRQPRVLAGANDQA